MASIENRNGSWRVIFRYQGKKRYFTIGEVSHSDAVIYSASTEELQRLLARNLVSVPMGCSIEDFMYHKGNPPTKAADHHRLTLSELREAYFTSQVKKLEQTTLDGIRLHFCHLERILGRVIVAQITRPDLQKYVDTRSNEWIDPNVYRKARKPKQYKRAFKKPRPVKAEPDRPKRHPSPATIKKEIISLRTAWNWARRQLGLKEEFPGGGLDFAKIEEGLPFMTWDEAERRIATGDDPEKVWDCLYLRPAEIAELLEYIKSRPVSPWVLPMFVFAAYTGARRSEIVRALPSDIDLQNGFITLREKKRDKTKTTTRRVPISPALRESLVQWMKDRANGKTFFCKMDGKAITPREAHNYFQRALRTSKWSVIRGWHTLRHSFVSACASRGVDQRMLQEWCGHMSPEMSRRYAHLWPSSQQEAIKTVFG
jgi:integrase